MFSQANRVELSYNVIKGEEHFVSLQTSVIITDEYEVVVNSEERTGTRDYLTTQTRCRIYRCRYNRVRMHYQGDQIQDHEVCWAFDTYGKEHKCIQEKPVGFVRPAGPRRREEETI